MTLLTCAQTLANVHDTGLARLDAQRLLLHALGRPATDRAWLLSHDHALVLPAQATMLQASVQRILAGAPMAYVLGEQEFFGLSFQIDARVLVPRPDTETLVQWTLDVLDTMYVAAATATPSILDLGTGSGAIAIALAHHLRLQSRSAEILATDASAEALAVAAHNAEQHGWSQAADALCASGARSAVGLRMARSHWFEGISGRYQLIVSNPPYIAQADPHLPALQHEPLSALASGPDGLDDIRLLIAQAPSYLNAQGWLLLEHGYDQAPAVAHLFTQHGFRHVQHRHDLAGIARCTGGQWIG